MMMARDNHAIAQPALPQRRLQIGHALVAVLGIVHRRANRRCSLVAGWNVAVHAGERDLRTIVDGRRNDATCGVLDQSDRSCRRRHERSFSSRATSPISRARATSLSARFTTGGSIILEPKLTTPSPRFSASSYAATILSAFSISAADGAYAWCTTGICSGWMQPMPSNPSPRELWP